MYKYGDRKPENAGDGRTSTYFTSGNMLEWLQLDFGSEIRVAGFEFSKRTVYYRHFVNIEVRVGNEDAKGSSNTKLLTINEVCGIVAPTARRDEKETLTCPSPLTGRYATLQTKVNNRIQVTEVTVITEKPGEVISTGSSSEEVKTVYKPSLCSKASDPYCDPNWTPFGNMNMALMGYDIVESDPLAKGGDKGFRSQIFGAVVIDGDGRMVLSDGIAAVDMLECESNFDSKTVSTLSVSLSIPY